MADRLARKAAAAYLRDILGNVKPDRAALVDVLYEQAERHGDRALAAALKHHGHEVTLLDEVATEVAAMCHWAHYGIDLYWAEHEHQLDQEEARRG